jgi:hypothetical protein
MKQTLISLVGRLKPGQRIDIAIDTLRQITPYEHNGARFNPVDQILGNIIGAAYEFCAWENWERRSVTFERLKEPLTGGLRTHVDPDRRDYFRKRPDGFYEMNDFSRQPDFVAQSSA